MVATAGGCHSAGGWHASGGACRGATKMARGLRVGSMLMRLIDSALLAAATILTTAWAVFLGYIVGRLAGWFK